MFIGIMFLLYLQQNKTSNKGKKGTTLRGDGVTMSGDHTVPCIGGDCFYMTENNKV